MRIRLCLCAFFSGVEMSKFQELYQLSVNDKVEKKNGLTYLSWAFAWAEFVKVYPEATYKIKKDHYLMPYFSDKSGGMVYTEVTAGGLTHEMWLPIMDHRNKTIPYDAITAFDINKTLMRCLVKNLAMFGLGLYIYAGEDIPEAEIKVIDKSPTVKSESFDLLVAMYQDLKDHIPDKWKERVVEILAKGTPAERDLAYNYLSKVKKGVEDANK